MGSGRRTTIRFTSEELSTTDHPSLVTGFQGEIWLTKKEHKSMRPRVRGRDPKGHGRAEIARVEIVRGLAAVGAVRAEVHLAKADGSFSGARKSASSAPRNQKTSTTRITGCLASLWLRA